MITTVGTYWIFSTIVSIGIVKKQSETQLSEWKNAKVHNEHGVSQLINGINCANVKINQLLANTRHILFLTIAQLPID